MSREALATLCQTDWRPVYAFVRRNGYDGEQLRDLVQAFFHAASSRKTTGSMSTAQRGRFRSFLLHGRSSTFFPNERDRAHAIKRGGGQVPVSMLALEVQLPASGAPHALNTSTPESLF